MTLAFTITAVAIVIVGLFAVIIERTTERDEARAEADRLSRDLKVAYESLNTTLDEHALCPVPARPNLRVVRSPIPMQREPKHDHLTDDEWFARLYDDRGELR